MEIEIAAPEPGWAEEQLQQATALLARGDPRSVSDGMVVDPPIAKLRTELALAGRVLRFLETRDAAEALAHFYENGPMGAQEDIRFGLFASPYRKEVIQAMERALATPDVPITSKYFDTLMQLLNLGDKKPSPLELTGLQKSFQDKQVLNQRAAPSPPFTDDFSSLQPETQQRLLTGFWPQIAAPSLEAPLQAIAEGPSIARDIALLRLYDLNPNVARKIAIERIRKMDVTDVTHRSSNPPHSLLKPDAPIPALDDALVNKLQEQDYPVSLLVARYASDAVLERVRAIAAKQPGFPCGSLLAYFFRVDPTWASQQLAEARQKRRGACPLNVPLTETLAISPGLEQAAIDDLRSPDPTIQNAAQKLLQKAESLTAKQPLWDALSGLSGVVQDIKRQTLEDSLVDALSRARGWVLNSEELGRLTAGCLSETCRRKVNVVRTALQTPVLITPRSDEVGDYADIGPFRIHDQEQFPVKIAQFPRGTQFRLAASYEGTWLWEQRTRQIRAMLEAAGMELAGMDLAGMELMVRPLPPIRVGGNVDSAKMIRKVPPVYPAEARASHTEGAVVLHVIIGTDGIIKETYIISGNTLLVLAALDAVRQWQYQPTLLNGSPVEVDTTITIDFPPSSR
jgi:TonB family protein